MKAIKADFYINNRRKLISLFKGSAPIVLTANGLIQQNSDITYPFKQDSSFWYFTGISEPDVILVIDRTKEYLILPVRPHFTDVSEGKLNVDLMAKQSGVNE